MLKLVATSRLEIKQSKTTNSDCISRSQPRKCPILGVNRNLSTIGDHKNLQAPIIPSTYTELICSRDAPCLRNIATSATEKKLKPRYCVV